MSKKNVLRVILLSLTLLGIIAAGLLAPVKKASAASSVLVNAATTYQVIDGFGASDAFHTGKYVSGYGSTLTPAQSAKIIELLFSPTTGAGLNIIRHQVGSSTAMVTGVPSTGDGDNLASIEPTDPGGPNATPVYVWDTADPDKGQVWFTQQAMLYVDPIVYADAWSPPAYMKTNGLLTGGGYLCGAVGAPTCTSGDWRQHYANYLTQYVKFYQNEGINIKYIGFGNEPEFSPSYTGANWDSTTVAGGRGTLTTTMPQNIDFIKNYLGPTLASAGLTTKVSCCEATSWANTAIYTSGILADSTAANYVGLITGHGYWGSPNGLVTTPISAGTKHVWQSESSNFDAFTAAWDDGSNGSGFIWAENLYNALVKANANGYLYWWFAQRNSGSSTNEDLIHMYDTTYTVTKRLWAFANYSRFIRPGATRINATSDNANLHITAAKNTDGSYAIVVLNTSTTDESTSFDLSGGNFATTVTPYLTNATNDTAQQATITRVGTGFSATIPARSLVTYKILDGGPTPTPCTACSPTPTKTSTRTPSPTPTLCLSCVLSVQYQAGDTSASSSQPSPHFKIVNTSASAIPLSGLTLRYWYTIDGVKTQGFNCDYSVVGCSNVVGSFGTLSTATSTADSYLQIGFTAGAGSIAAGGNSGEIQARINKSDWTAYTQTNDYSFDATKTAYTAWNNVTLYSNGVLIWGVEPGGVVAATNTPTLTATQTRSLTPAITNTLTRTLTPLPVTNTPTRTLTPAITNTPSRTSTRTLTPAISTTPTRTATRTFTPTVGISNTPTRTPTVGISSTPTRTPTTGPTTTRTPTATIVVVDTVCTPVTSTITAPFTFDGAGQYCWQASTLATYINSWNTTSINVNGVDYTNLYTAVSSLPAKIGGYWYIGYNSAVAWGHFEAK